MTAPLFASGSRQSPFFAAASSHPPSFAEPTLHTPGVYLRSQRLLSSISSRVTHDQKVQLEREMVHALEIPGIPYMCTESICTAYGTLRSSLLELITLYDELYPKSSNVVQ